MSVVIRMSRRGRKKKPFYSIVAVDKRAKRDGRFLDKIGTYDPFKKDCSIDEALLKKWMDCGALLSERVAFLVKKLKSPS